MQRRTFLTCAASLAALGLVPASAMADAATFGRFHAALERDPTLAVYANTVGQQAGAARITGRIPSDLNGVFFRNGPGRFELGGERHHHWFDGDGFAQRWQIGGGKVSHIGKFVDTERFTEENAAGQFLYPSFGTYVGRRGVKTNDTMNAANTNLLPFNGRLYALWEGGSATEVDARTLATVGIKTWNEDMKSMPFSAHPKIEPNGGMWNFGVLPGGDRLALYRIGADGQVQRTAMVKVTQLGMVHDFAVSEKHLIFLIPPYDVIKADDQSFADQHHWAGSGANARALRVVVVSKDSMEIRQIFELPPHMVFHFGNAFDDGATTRFDVVLHEGDALAQVGRVMRGERQKNSPARGFAAQVTLDYASGQATTARLFGASEFPRVMPQVVSRRHRQLALLSSSSRNADIFLDTVNLVATDTGKADSYRFDTGWQVEEHVLVARANARSETDGYLVGVAQDTKRGHTVMTVFDAAHVKAGPLALARLPYRAPHCFHGNFLAA
ncbi:carotenoid oxygenase family protein [Massilia antarctica]|uniref:carotenoid oxygenase family protein n=1 Tax=Massilia antarctica TaxID=2765360 RepID=UPI0006BB5FFB|nr:carotenoid oxygenase family protein [Massilia sp. H27-R4]MCY0912762.1 carotenoid oxygenase family protein [Massilia sp. H27-R4]CUI03833.1 Lignostilbene-alpha,beta-dioxygenase and related enzymes [Janthinobacterium sp. CG23_2]CUU27619.1 Lignostilbene-alpha,beta-dioxygenase and related enzymes [Janthinobacterium sp. CG23_2]